MSYLSILFTHMNQYQTHPEQIIKQLFDDLFHHLVLSSFKYVNDYEQAEEIVQDVFVKVWQNFEQVKLIKDLKAYLFKAVKNSSLNFLKHIKVRQKFIQDSEVLAERDENQEHEVMSEFEIKDKVHEAVNKL
ncbi:MAG: hypothetical protein C0597_09740, partial [Marinilabiliales bacterium]